MARVRDVWSVSWSPRGDELLLYSLFGQTWYEPPSTSIRVLNRVTGEIDQLAGIEERPTMPVWSPDGTRFAFTSKETSIVIADFLWQSARAGGRRGPLGRDYLEPRRSGTCSLPLGMPTRRARSSTCLALNRSCQASVSNLTPARRSSPLRNGRPRSLCHPTRTRHSCRRPADRRFRERALPYASPVESGGNMPGFPHD